MTAERGPATPERPGSSPRDGGGTLTTRDGTRLAHRIHDSRTPSAARSTPLLFLHGLAGHQGEWDDVLPRFLADGHKVVTYDARGHGDSTRSPRDMTRAACAGDAVALIDHLSLAPVTLIGQSLGGHTALLTAAAHPDLIRSLVLIEAGPAQADPGLPQGVGAWMDSRPERFDSRAHAVDFFGHEAWARGLEEREDGWYPKVERDRMIAAVTELSERSYWQEWAQVRCPTLVVRGERGTMPESEQTGMRARRPEGTTLEVIPDAGHDVHLDQPERLHAAISAFLKAEE
ncbi:alpha/beta fold hydrolase [Streptomyces sp. NPDC001848]|uniref:alpha/beta fold hydrolase n=1 Tax=Streptomyces sp. NPDC001848 TaxID=3364618 RepID=UPI003677FB05